MVNKLHEEKQYSEGLANVEGERGDGRGLTPLDWNKMGERHEVDWYEDDFKQTFARLGERYYADKMAKRHDDDIVKSVHWWQGQDEPCALYTELTRHQKCELVETVWDSGSDQLSKLQGCILNSGCIWCCLCEYTSA